jgi:ribosome-associated protein
MEELLEVTTKQLEVSAEIKCEMICEAADEIKAQDIVVLDVRELTTLADYFVMCSGTSTTHIQSIAQGVREKLRERAGLRAKPEGDSASLWIIMDYGDVILHIFDQETREFYDLERLWADAKASKFEPRPQTNDEGEDDTATGRLNRLRQSAHSRVQ